MNFNRPIRLRNRHLGDNWTSVGYLLSCSERMQRPVKVDHVAIAFDGERWRTKPLVRRIAKLLDSAGRIRFTDEEGIQVDEAFVRAAWRHTVPCTRRWSGSGMHVCVQFSGSSWADRKSIPERHAERLVDGLIDCGYQIVPLGLPMSLEEMVESLANCRFMIGIESGCMHVAHSVGCPRFLVRNSMHEVDITHAGRTWTGCANAIECLERIRSGDLPSPGI